MADSLLAWPLPRRGWLGRCRGGVGLAAAAAALASNADHDSGAPSSGAIAIHETTGPSVPGPAGAWLDQGWYTGANGHRLNDFTVSQLLDKYTGTGTAWLTRRHCSARPSSG